MDKEVDVKAYVELISKIGNIKILINRIRKAAEGYDKQVQNATEMLIYEYEDHVTAVEENLLGYFRNSEGAKKEIKALELYKNVLEPVLIELETGKYNKRVTNKEYKDFIKRMKAKQK